MINFKVFTHNKNNKEVVLFECNVTNRTIYNIITDPGNCYGSGFLHALNGKFSIEIFNKNYTTTIVKIDSSNWLENIKAYGNFLQKHLPGVFVEIKID